MGTPEMPQRSMRASIMTRLSHLMFGAFLFASCAYAVPVGESLVHESPDPVVDLFTNERQGLRSHASDADDLDTGAGSGTLPSGSNKNPPMGYSAKAGSGPCRCRGSGYGLDSCGELCCAHSPYTDPDPNGKYYFGKGGTRTSANLCYEKAGPAMAGCYSTRTRPFGTSYSSSSVHDCLVKCKDRKYAAFECPRKGMVECICGDVLPASNLKL